MHDKDFQHAMYLLARTTPGSLTGFHQEDRQSQQRLQAFISFHARHQSAHAKLQVFEA
jgi:hypothetical protein